VLVLEALSPGDGIPEHQKIELPVFTRGPGALRGIEVGARADFALCAANAFADFM